jgi:superfamily I DNA/RNA helicase
VSAPPGPRPRAPTQVLKRIGEQWGCHAYMLPTNYRCAPRVLDAARALIESSLVRAQKLPLLAAAVAMGHGGGELRTVAFPDRATELDALGGELQRLQRQQPGRLCGVAVLCRLRAQVDEVRADASHPIA